MSIAHTAHQARTRRCYERVTTRRPTAPVRVRAPSLARSTLMRSPDHALGPDTRHVIATIADRLRRLPCTDSVIAMDLHRIARELEKIAAAAGPAELQSMTAAAATPTLSPALGDA